MNVRLRYVVLAALLLSAFSYGLQHGVAEGLEQAAEATLLWVLIVWMFLS